MNTAAKGRRQEHRSMALYKALGFTCVRAAASKGAWDFVAFSNHNVVIVQVRSGKWPSPAERRELARFKAPVSVIREIHRWRRRARRPDVKAWIAGAWRVQP